MGSGISVLYSTDPIFCDITYRPLERQDFYKCSDIRREDQVVPDSSEALWVEKHCASWSNLMYRGILTGQVTLASNLNKARNNPCPSFKENSLCDPPVQFGKYTQLQTFQCFCPVWCGEGGHCRVSPASANSLSCVSCMVCGPPTLQLSSSPKDGHINCTCLIEFQMIWICKFLRIVSVLVYQCWFCAMESEVRGCWKHVYC